jgi:hypothetical protein
MTPKELKKLADACRKAGVLHYRQGDVEFTLSPTPPSKVVKSSPKQTASVQADEVPSDGWDALSEEDKLFYSIGGIPVVTAGN